MHPIVQLVSRFIQVHHDLFDQGPHDLLFQDAVGTLVMPHPLQVGRQLRQLFPLGRRNQRSNVRVEFGQPLLGLSQLLQGRIPFARQLATHLQVSFVRRLVLPRCTRFSLARRAHAVDQRNALPRTVGGQVFGNTLGSC